MAKHLIMITRGREDGGHAATLGAELAVSLQMMRHEVAIFLTLGGTRWAYQGLAKDVHVPGHLCLEEYFDSFAAEGGQLLVCAPCVKAYCHLPTLSDEEQKRGLRPEAEYVGLATVAGWIRQGNATVF